MRRGGWMQFESFWFGSRNVFMYFPGKNSWKQSGTFGRTLVQLDWIQEDGWALAEICNACNISDVKQWRSDML